jgi:hypothetical protein
MEQAGSLLTGIFIRRGSQAWWYMPVILTLGR